MSLIRAWAAQRNRGRTWSASGPSLRRFLTEALSVCAQTPPADDLAGAFRQILDQARIQPANPWIITLLIQAADLATSARSSDTPAAQRDLTLAAALVLAALHHHYPAASRPSQGLDEAATFQLQSALTTLVALTAPSQPNQTMLLVKA
jgi:hypothetical protein